MSKRRPHPIIERAIKAAIEAHQWRVDAAQNPMLSTGMHATADGLSQVTTCMLAQVKR